MDWYLSDVIELRIPEFEILPWWKRNSFIYPIIAEITRDVLVIPISTIASESTFSTSERVLDPYRSSLAPETIQALICTQNWLDCKLINSWEVEKHVGGVDIEVTFLFQLQQLKHIPLKDIGEPSKVSFGSLDAKKKSIKDILIPSGVISGALLYTREDSDSVSKKTWLQEMIIYNIFLGFTQVPGTWRWMLGVAGIPTFGSVFPHVITS